jgi:hypothetical protein
VSSRPGEARTILLSHIITDRPSKQPLMVRTFLKVYMELGSDFLFLQEQIKDIIIINPPPQNVEVSLCTLPLPPHSIEGSSSSSHDSITSNQSLYGNIYRNLCLCVSVCVCVCLCVSVSLSPVSVSVCVWTLEIPLRGNVIISKAQKAIQADDCRPRQRSSSRFPLLAPTRDSFRVGGLRRRSCFGPRMF